MSCSAVVDVVLDGGEMVKRKPLLTPLYTAEITTQPLTTAGAVREKDADVEPCGTVTEGGINTVVSELVRGMVMAPAAFESVTVQVVVAATTNSEEAQVTEDSAGVDHSVRAAVCEDAPRVAVMLPVVSATMFPILTPKILVELPADRTMLAGTEMTDESAVIVSVVTAATNCESVTVHKVEEPDIRPAGEQESELTVVTTATREMGVDCEEPLYAAETDPF
jgi:hypothetical protein